MPVAGPLVVGASTALTVTLLVAVGVLELALLLVALIDLARRPAEAVSGGRRWPWLLLIVLLNVVGPIVYLAAGRLPATGGAPVPATGARATENAEAVPGVGAGPAAGPPPAANAADAAPGAVGAVAALYGAAVPLADGPAIELQGVTKRFGDVTALDGLSLAVPAGSVFGFLGPNGAGKTTALRILGGLAWPTAGSARVLGRVVGDGGSDVRAQLGYLPDVPAFYGWMTAPEYLRFAGSLFGLRGDLLESRVVALLELAGLEGVATHVAGFSRGMKQRLGVAQALVNAPRLLLLDEPTSALDPIGRRDVLAMIAALRDRTTVLFSTHILADVERVCDTVAILDHGRVVAQAGIDELRRRHGGTHRLAVEVDDPARLAADLHGIPWLGAAEVAADGTLLLSVDDLAAAQRELPARVARLGLALRRLESDELSLEDVFVALVEGDAR